MTNLAPYSSDNGGDGAPLAPEEQRKAVALAALADNVGKPLPPALACYWMRLLRHYTAEQVEAGVDRLFRNHKYRSLPTFAVLLESIHAACGLPDPATLTRDPDAEAEAAWMDVIGQIRKIGSWGQPKFDENQWPAVRACGGWRRLCSTSSDELHTWTKKLFINAYKNRICYGSAMDSPAAFRHALSARQVQALPSCGAKLLEVKKD